MAFIESTMMSRMRKKLGRTLRSEISKILCSASSSSWSTSEPDSKPSVAISVATWIRLRRTALWRTIRA